MHQFLDKTFTAKQMPYLYDCTNQLFILSPGGDCSKMMQWNVRFLEFLTYWHVSFYCIK